MAEFGQMLLNRGSYGSMQFMKSNTCELMLLRKLTAELGPDANKTLGLGLDGQLTKFGHGAASAATSQAVMKAWSNELDEVVVVVDLTAGWRTEARKTGNYGHP